jgi:hypothetical protein
MRWAMTNGKIEWMGKEYGRTEVKVRRDKGNEKINPFPALP